MTLIQQGTKQLNLNRGPLRLSQHVEKSPFSAHPKTPAFRAKPLNLNHEVKL